MIIPKLTDNQALEGWIRKHYVSIKKVQADGSLTDFMDRVWITNNDLPYTIVEDIEPGDYVITDLDYALVAQWRTIGVEEDTFPLNLKFSIQPDTIHVLEYEFLINQFSRGDGVRTEFNIRELQSDMCKAVIKQIEREPALALWNSNAIPKASMCESLDVSESCQCGQAL